MRSIEEIANDILDIGVMSDRTTSEEEDKELDKRLKGCVEEIMLHIENAQ